MSRKLTILICIVSVLLSGRAIAADTAATATAPVAYVYVTVSTNGPKQIVGYAASADGQLTLIPGSPFYAVVQSLAVNGKYLFASANTIPSTSSTYKKIYSYAIGSNGALKYIGATSIAVGSGNSCNEASILDLDHTGSYLYVYAVGVDCTTDSMTPELAYESFSVDKSTGLVHYLSTTNALETLTAPLALSANNKFAYAIANTGYSIDGTEPQAYQRQTSGELMGIPVDIPNPAGGPSGFLGIDQGPVATDASNHMAILETYVVNSGGVPQRIATYSIDTSDGDLSTSSTYTNMPAPAAALGQVTAMRMSPSGKLLAVGGVNGLQIFHFYGTKQATPFTGVLPTDQEQIIYWDSANHVYVLTLTKLYVFTVTSTGAKQAPGSPYAVPTHQANMIVQPE